MRFFGLEVSLRKALLPTTGNGRWIDVFDSNRDRPPGAFQKDVHCDPALATRNWTVFACQTLIAGDMGKMRLRMMERDSAGIESEKDATSFSPVLRKPNGFQTQQKFIESWILSKIGHGNAYIALNRDQRNVVTSMSVLDPYRVTPLIAPDGSVYYRLGKDWLAQVTDDDIVVPASEIIHDRMWCLFHPLVGIAPLYASSLAALQGLEIQSGQASFFANKSQPSGILLAPGPIDDIKAVTIRERWKEFRSRDRGGTAVLADGMTYQPVAQNAVDSQLVEQLKMSAEMICSTYHVPGYKVGVGATPTYQNAEILNQIYYDDCLQTLIRGVESSIDEGLALPKGYCTKFDLDDLLRMDASAQMATLKEGVSGGIVAPNEARARINLGKAKGGDSPMIQQQNYSLEALAKRDAGPDPFASNKPSPADPQREFADMVRRECELLAA